MKITVLAVALASFSSILPVAAQAVMLHYQVNIPRQPLDAALKDFARQTGLQVARFSDRVDGSALVGPVNGDLSADEALKSLLGPRGFGYKLVNERTIVVVNPGAEKSAAPAAALSANPNDANKANDKEDSQSKSFGETFRLAQVDRGANPATAAIEPTHGQAINKPSQALDEIVVTAQKQEQRLQDVPASVTALPAASLAMNNLLRLQDYYTTVPGLSLVSNGNGATTLSIRGITTGGFGGSTVGIVVDDAPFGLSTPLAFRQATPDIDPSELDRIEVLSGPQGTLYGASSIGGLVKFVTLDPSTDALSGRVEAGVNSVHNGAQPGYNFRGAINVPVTDSLAVRASGFVRRDAGYVDGEYLGTPPARFDGINEQDVQGGRLSVLWRPSQAWSVKLNALFQHSDTTGPSDITVPDTSTVSPLGDLVDRLRVRGVHAFTEDLRSYTATVAGQVGSVKLVSISGYNSDRFTEPFEATSIYGRFANLLYQVNGAQVNQIRLTKKFTEELRASGPLTGHLDWLAGLFYTHEDSPTHDTLVATDPTTLTSPGLLFDDYYPTTYQEYAAFADLTFHLTDRFDIQIGGRESRNQQNYRETIEGPAVPIFYSLPSPVIQTPVHTNDNTFTYLVTPTFKFTPDFLAYARIASGYRPGGPNPTCEIYAVPCHFGPDKTINYELGLKTEQLEHRLSVDAAIYRIDWKDIQLQVFNEAFTTAYFTNARSAKSQGAELTVRARPLADTQLGAWLAWTDAELTSPLPANGLLAGSSGDQLPYSSRFSGNVSADQKFHLSEQIAASVGVTGSYVGDRKSDFAGSATVPRLNLGSYSLINVHAGINVNSWTATLYLNNAADHRGVISGRAFPVSNVVYIQPRTVGLTLTEQF